LVEQDHVGLDVEETKGDLPVAEGLLSSLGRDKPADEKSELRNYMANRPQNTVRILIKYIVSPIFFLYHLMYF
jgi:hypothetical protein